MKKNAKERIHAPLSATSAKRLGMSGTAPKKEGRVKGQRARFMSRRGEEQAQSTGRTMS